MIVVERRGSCLRDETYVKLRDDGARSQPVTAAELAVIATTQITASIEQLRAVASRRICICGCLLLRVDETCPQCELQLRKWREAMRS